MVADHHVGVASRLAAAMILYVDYEHASTYMKARTDWLLAARTRISYMLQDVTGHRCLLQRYTDVDAGIIDEFGIAAVFISGNGADADAYDPDDLDGLIGDHQVGRRHRCSGSAADSSCSARRSAPRSNGSVGSPTARRTRTRRTSRDGARNSATSPSNCIGEHPLLDGLDRRPVFRHAHTWELKNVPDGLRQPRPDRTDRTAVPGPRVAAACRHAVPPRVLDR